MQALAGDRIGGAERLIHQHHGRIGGERACNTHPLLLSAAELFGVSMGKYAGVELHGVQQFVHPRGCLLLGPPQQARNDGDVLGNRHVGEQADLLNDVADVTPELVRIQRQHISTIDGDRTRARLDDPVDHLHRGGFTAPRRADEHDQFAGFDGHREVVDGGHSLARVLLGHVVERDADPAGVARDSCDAGDG